MKKGRWFNNEVLEKLRTEIKNAVVKRGHVTTLAGITHEQLPTD